MWCSNRERIVPAFVDLARAQAATVESEDFTAPNESENRINAAVSKQTDGAIPSLLGVPPDPQTSLLLTAVLTFRDHWAVPFRPGLTTDWKFTGPKGAIPMKSMNQETILLYGETATAQVVELPYEGDDAMDVILPFGPHTMLLGYSNPPAGTPADPMQELAATEADLHRDGFPDFSRLAKHFIELNLPRMTIAYGSDLHQPLHALGLDAVFDQQRADLSGIADGHPWLGAILHRATLTCDELGTVASAAAAMEIPAAPAPDAAVRVDHPFIVVIRNVPSGRILFVARVVDPSLGTSP
jgi:serpin B